MRIQTQNKVSGRVSDSENYLLSSDLGVDDLVLLNRPLLVGVSSDILSPLLDERAPLGDVLALLFSKLV